MSSKKDDYMLIYERHFKPSGRVECVMQVVNFEDPVSEAIPAFFRSLASQYFTEQGSGDIIVMRNPQLFKLDPQTNEQKTTGPAAIGGSPEATLH